MAPKLYATLVSPPARAAWLCAKAIDLQIEFVDVDIMKGEQMKPEFIKLNPLHTVPVLDDNGFVLTDSHAIMVYLVETYAKDKSLYPADVKKRARINQLLHFDSGTFFPRHLRVAVSFLFGQVKEVSEENKISINEAFSFIETFLQNNKYIAGDDLSIADFSVLTSVTNASVFVPLEEVKYPKIISWKKTLEALPYAKINKDAYELVQDIVKTLISK